ncbi:uncharacterized protein LOC144116187 isoform X3 [Amblyomma americanum]
MADGPRPSGHRLHRPRWCASNQSRSSKLSTYSTTVGSSPVPSQASLNIRKGDLSDRPYTSSAGLKPVASCGTERSGNIVAGRSKKGSRHGCTTFDPTSTESPCGSETGSLHSASHLFLSRASPLVSEASPLGFAPA